MKEDTVKGYDGDKFRHGQDQVLSAGKSLQGIAQRYNIPFEAQIEIREILRRCVVGTREAADAIYHPAQTEDELMEMSLKTNIGRSGDF